jgi:hypothetical protein
MPIPKYDGSPENEWIPKCMSGISSEYEQEQALAICYNQMDEEMSLTALAGIPLDIIGDNEVKILEYLPDVKSGEREDPYLNRCVPVLYPEYYDQTMATSLCADKYQRKTTVTNLIKEISKLMKPTKNTFEDNRIKFRAALAVADVRAKGIELKFAEEGGGTYPWDECIADQIKQYGDEETAKKVCGYIKSTYGS